MATAKKKTTRATAGTKARPTARAKTRKRESRTHVLVTAAEARRFGLRRPKGAFTRTVRGQLHYLVPATAAQFRALRERSGRRPRRGTLVALPRSLGMPSTHCRAFPLGDERVSQLKFRGTKPPSESPMELDPESEEPFVPRGRFAPPGVFGNVKQNLLITLGNIHNFADDLEGLAQRQLREIRDTMPLNGEFAGYRGILIGYLKDAIRTFETSRETETKQLVEYEYQEFIKYLIRYHSKADDRTITKELEGTIPDLLRRYSPQTTPHRRGFHRFWFDKIDKVLEKLNTGIKLNRALIEREMNWGLDAIPDR
jgi:hypothetical protein